VSKWLAQQAPGATVEMKGPFVKFAYTPNKWDAVGLIAGGTGITPMYQLITEILANPRDHTEVRLVYASRTPADIILKTELDALSVTHPNFKVIYTVDAPGPAGWSGATGYVTKDMVTSFLPPPQPEAGRHQILVCGPPPMMNSVRAVHARVRARVRAFGCQWAGALAAQRALAANLTAVTCSRAHACSCAARRRAPRTRARWSGSSRTCTMRPSRSLSFDEPLGIHHIHAVVAQSFQKLRCP